MFKESVVTSIALVALLFLLANLPRMIFGEGFSNAAPYNGASPIGKYDGKQAMSCGTPVRDEKVKGDIVVPQAGGSAFTPPVQPYFGEYNEEADLTRNATSTDEKACVSSSLSTSTGCVVLTAGQSKNLATRGGNNPAGTNVTF